MLHERHFRAMNTDVGVWLWSATRGQRPTIVRSLDWAERMFAGVEDELSRFRPTSALSRLNQAAGHGPQVVSPVLWAVLMAALDAADDSGGIYDPTLLRSLERIGYDRSFDTGLDNEAAEAIACAPAFGAWQRVRTDADRRTVSLPADLTLDLGGIAKGWTADQLAASLAPLGPVLVDAGGDLRVIGSPAGEAWPIAVQDAFLPDRNATVVQLNAGALATSSVGGRRWHRGPLLFHHLIDPRTGTSAQSDLHAVTVCAPSAAIADVAAKVVLVLGSAMGSTYLRGRGLSALLTTVKGRRIPVGDFQQDEALRHGTPYSH